MHVLCLYRMNEICCSRFFFCDIIVWSIRVGNVSKRDICLSFRHRFCRQEVVVHLDNFWFVRLLGDLRKKITTQIRLTQRVDIDDVTAKKHTQMCNLVCMITEFWVRLHTASWNSEKKTSIIQFSYRCEFIVILMLFVIGKNSKALRMYLFWNYIFKVYVNRAIELGREKKVLMRWYRRGVLVVMVDFW